MTMSKEYQIIMGVSIQSLEDHINFLLKEGWELQGGVSVVLLEETTDDISRYYQAVVKIKNETE